MEDDGNIAFEVDSAIHLGANRWRVNGRAFQDLRTGDAIVVQEGQRLHVFSVVALSAYGKDIPELARGMTGSLTVEGDDGEPLAKTRFLRRGEDDDVAFAVDSTVHLGANKWRVDGRAFQDVRVGDIVIMRETHGSHMFSVSALSAYGKESPQLFRGMTGVLIMEGDNGELLANAGTLLRSEQQSK